MRIANTYINTVNGEQNSLVKTSTIVKDGVSIVSIKGISLEMLNSEFGAGIEIEIDGAESWMADYRHSEFWCRPAFGNEFTEVPDETQGLIYKKSNGKFGVVLPIVSDNYKCVICGCSKNSVTAKLFSWYPDMRHCSALAFVAAEGENPYALLEKCTEYALLSLKTGCRTRKERRYPEVFEYLGWCSWDALQIRVNEKDIIKKCEEFKSKGIPAKWAIIDDMWGEVHDFYEMNYSSRQEMFDLMHSSKLFSFNADPLRFPNGLGHCIDEMKKYDMKVGIWHPTTGYWAGIDPDGEIFKDYKDCLIRTADGRYIPNYNQEKAYKYFNAFHDYLRSCGTDFVKIDNQSLTRRFYKCLAPIGQVAREYHNAIEASVGQHFDNQMINCMGMASEDIWNRTVSPISRCSDDFQPEDSAWFTKHILQCSYNDLIQGQFYYCDWDMWWTDDGQAVKNSILRAVSGGPIYVSDEIGRSKKEILDPLILSDGRILRCNRPAMPTADCITADPTVSGRIFKLQNMCKKSGIIAVFNIDGQNRAVCGSISPNEVDGIEGDEFAVYEHFSKTLTMLKLGEKLDISLNNIGEFKLYVIVPVNSGFAAIGRTDKFVSPATIKSVFNNTVELIEDGEYAVVENGKLIFKNK